MLIIRTEAKILTRWEGSEDHFVFCLIFATNLWTVWLDQLAKYQKEHFYRGFLVPRYILLDLQPMDISIPFRNSVVFIV